MADSPDRGELLTALTTEHFTLQGARSQAMSESSSRAALFIGAVSSTLVALGFLGQLSPAGDTFNTFALTVLPTLYLLGVFTFVRLVQSGQHEPHGTRRLPPTRPSLAPRFARSLLS